ncbi:hypothetical protein [Pyrobaculum ferrireducens]|uniref:Uncharacterized protein n=1 Tax=Pyrobaculum ferrireducens TaxID=1104324 RepID=G7VC01_9CREN|nr:hypothetical protein [Pyrobaculum ferrireducens]AET32501.1 hypothetical protein P186_1065 [Pyrobaculum ferrireducens]
MTRHRLLYTAVSVVLLTALLVKAGYLCVDKNYIYHIGPPVEIYDKKSLKLHDWIEVHSASPVCVAVGDDAYAFIDESLVKLTPRGVDKKIKPSGW